MTPREWQNLQEALLFVFGPLITWWIVGLVVACVLAAILIPMFSVLRGIMRRWQ